MSRNDCVCMCIMRLILKYSAISFQPYNSHYCTTSTKPYANLLIMNTMDLERLKHDQLHLTIWTKVEQPHIVKTYMVVSLLIILISPGLWALYLWSNGSIFCYIFVLEFIWYTYSTCCFSSRKFSFISTTAFLQCSGTLSDFLTLSLLLLRLFYYHGGTGV